MAAKKYAVHYDDYSTPELEIFIKDRGALLPDQEKQARQLESRPTYIDVLMAASRYREACIGLLKRLDDTQTFPIMRLPPELRLLIYRELLIEDPVPGHTQLLRASTMIHHEASDVLYGEYLVTVTGKFTLLDLWSPPCAGPYPYQLARIRIGDRKELSTKDTTDPRQAFEDIINPFRQYQRLQLEVDLRDESRCPTDQFASRSSWTLFEDFLSIITSTCTDLRSVTISVFVDTMKSTRNPIVFQELAVPEPILPLTKLSPDCELYLRHVREAAEEAFWIAGEKDEEEKKACSRSD